MRPVEVPVIWTICMTAAAVGLGRGGGAPWWFLVLFFIAGYAVTGAVIAFYVVGKPSVSWVRLAVAWFPAMLLESVEDWITRDRGE